MKLIPSFLSSLLLLAVTSAQAQDARVVQSLSEVEYRTSLSSNGRIDLDSGVRRASYREQDRTVYRSAKAFLDGNRQTFGWKEPEVDLNLISDRRTESSRHVTYQQTFEGVPVLGHQVRVNLNRAGRVSLVMSAFEPLNQSGIGFDTVPSISKVKALDSALIHAANGDGRATEA